MFASPWVKRSEPEVEQKEVVDMTLYHLGIGGLMYISNDIELVTYAAKELAKSNVEPDDWAVPEPHAGGEVS